MVLIQNYIKNEDIKQWNDNPNISEFRMKITEMQRNFSVFDYKKLMPWNVKPISKTKISSHTIFMSCKLQIQLKHISQ